MRRQIDRSTRGAKSATATNGAADHSDPWARILVGHRDSVRSVAVLPDGQRALSGSDDRIMRLWDLKTGVQLCRFAAYSQVLSVAVLPSGKQALSGCDNGELALWDLSTGAQVNSFYSNRRGVLSVAVLPDGRRALSSGYDNAFHLWELETGHELRVFKGHRNEVWSVTALSDGRRALSGSDDRTFRLWDLETGTELHSFEGHSSYVRAVQPLPGGRQALSGSADRTMRLWDLATGAELRCFEGHWGSVNSVAVLPNGRRALSGSSDKTMRLWDVETGAELRRFEGHTGEVWSIALSPDGRRALSGSSDGTLRLWEIETFGGDADTVGYTTARIALLGDSGVGKTGLGWRIAHDEFREQASTHGQQFWVIDKLGSTRSDGTQCEAVLWDLAGQPDYRLIHALFLDRVDLGLLLFDAANRERPLAGIEYWVRHLRSATLRPLAIGQNPPCERLRSSAPTLLIAARSDRGTPTLNLGDIEEFCRGKEIAGYIVTSALEDIGVSELIEKIKATIAWDHLTATTTTRTFKRIKEHVLKLRELADKEVLLRPEELRRQLEQCGSEWHFSDAEMMTAVGHLANHGYVIQLKRASGEEAILLAPDLFKNLASSIVLEARRHERGLGLVDEARLLAGDYPLSELPGITTDVATALLDAIVRRFGAKPDKKIVDRQAASPSSWKTPFIATSIAW
jgi:WD40 repeat protein/GTPase SAR1 family protein